MRPGLKGMYVHVARLAVENSPPACARALLGASVLGRAPLGAWGIFF